MNWKAALQTRTY